MTKIKIRRIKIIPLLALPCFFFALPAIADPIAIAPDHITLHHYTVAYLPALIAETVVITILFKKRLSRLLPFFAVWLVLTNITWAALSVSLAATDSFGQADKIFLGEGIVVGVEAYAIHIILRNSRFALDAKNSPPWYSSLGASILGNFISLTAGEALAYF